MLYTPKRKSTVPFKLVSDPPGIDLDLPVYIESLSANFSPTWNTYTETGRAQPKVLLTQFSKTISVTFKIVAEDIQDRNTYKIFQDLESLSKLTMPRYFYNTDASYQGFFVKVTIGKVYIRQPMVLTSLNYTWDNTTMVWNMGAPYPGASTVAQLPMWTDVQAEFKWIGNKMPATQYDYTFFL